jgi:glycosyltransferase involved in cell wall biosynthesis
LAQDYPRIEHIILDGGSSDSTANVLKKYSAQITWFSEPDRGQSHAINKGFRMARSGIIGWLNSDDVYTEGAISKAVSSLLSNPDLGMVYGDAEIIDETGENIGFYKTEEFALGRLARHCFICQPATFMWSHVLADVGLLDEQLHYCMDLDLWIRIAQKYKVGYLSKCLAKSRWHLACKSVARREDALHEIMEVISRHYDHVPKGRIKAYCHERISNLIEWNFPLNSMFRKRIERALTFYYFYKYNFLRNGWGNLNKKEPFACRFTTIPNGSPKTDK